LWTYIKKERFDDFMNQYSSLENFSEELILLETDDAYFLPRLFAKNYPSKHLQIFSGNQDQFQPTEIKNIKFKGELREEQVNIINDLATIYQNNDNCLNGIVKARPGIGKTIMAIYLATQLKIKTLIIVDNQNLMKQWLQSFLDFTNLDIKDIGVIQKKAFGVDKGVIIGMAQTLLRKVKSNIQENFKIIDKAGIGLVIYDEVHSTSSAPVFSKVSLLFRTKNILGLSATPFQTGLAEILMKNSVGEIISNSKNYDTKPEYKLINYKSELDSKKIYVLNQMNDYLKKKSFYNKVIISSINYLNIIINQTRKAVGDGHRVMILCFTKIQVTTISNMLTENGIENTMFYGDQREIKYTETVLVATYSYAGKGFDYKQLSCLILACPLAGKKSLIQVVGRILRRDSNKLNPVVIDLADLSVPGFTIPEIRMKKKVILDEFECSITDEYC
jgi:superfamily II DNA or RNA helicase